MASRKFRLTAFRTLLVAALPCMGVLALRAAAPDEPAKDPVGIVEGDSILVQGAMSAIGGAVRIEQQLSGQSIVVPQSGDVLLSNGQLAGMRPGASRGSCELGELRIQQPLPQVSVPATAEEVKQRHLNDSKPNLPNARANPAADDGPIYQVFLPPMRFDSNLKVQPPPDPKLIVLVRRVRVRPTLIFEGRVEGDPLPAASLTAAKAKTEQPPSKNAPAANASVVERVKNFLKRHMTPI